MIFISWLIYILQCQMNRLNMVYKITNNTINVLSCTNGFSHLFSLERYFEMDDCKKKTKRKKKLANHINLLCSYNHLHLFVRRDFPLEGHFELNDCRKWLKIKGKNLQVTISFHLHFSNYFHLFAFTLFRIGGLEDKKTPYYSVSLLNIHGNFTGNIAKIDLVTHERWYLW